MEENRKRGRASWWVYTSFSFLNLCTLILLLFSAEGITIYFTVNMEARLTHLLTGPIRVPVSVEEVLCLFSKVSPPLMPWLRPLSSSQDLAPWFLLSLFWIFGLSLFTGLLPSADRHMLNKKSPPSTPKFLLMLSHFSFLTPAPG